ncbi:hypothetical protein EVAR_35698_1 [Eumeta japonica]|uniref:Uncharacterized protein n=1 Tax=Eumeta variegata TaxID=151549 RepID=A0A4C1VHP3_EUMVA|nr:hypothetical protein EVAR_35698_1 [Eumeta japonica]
MLPRCVTCKVATTIPHSGIYFTGYSIGLSTETIVERQKGSSIDNALKDTSADLAATLKEKHLSRSAD